MGGTTRADMGQLNPTPAHAHQQESSSSSHLSLPGTSFSVSVLTASCESLCPLAQPLVFLPRRTVPCSGAQLPEGAALSHTQCRPGSP